MFCKETVQMDYLLDWSAVASPNSCPSAVGLARLTNALTLRSRLKFNRLLLINMSKLQPVERATFNSFSIPCPLRMHHVWRDARFPSTYLTFLAVTDARLLPSYLLPEKPCWLVFSHFTLGFTPLTPNDRPGRAAWPLESRMLQSSSEGPLLLYFCSFSRWKHE